MAGKADRLKDFDLIQTEFAQPSSVEPISSAFDIVAVNDRDMIPPAKLYERTVCPIRGIEISLACDIVRGPFGQQGDAARKTCCMQNNIDGMAFSGRT